MSVAGSWQGPPYSFFFCVRVMTISDVKPDPNIRMVATEPMSKAGTPSSPTSGSWLLCSTRTPLIRTYELSLSDELAFLSRRSEELVLRFRRTLLKNSTL